MQEACRSLARFVAGKTFADYAADDLLRAAVERKFEIVGEALHGLLKRDPGLSSAITDSKKIIGFRNVLIHGYAIIKNDLVWETVQTKLPILSAEVDRLLENERQADDDPNGT